VFITFRKRWGVQPRPGNCDSGASGARRALFHDFCLSGRPGNSSRTLTEPITRYIPPGILHMVAFTCYLLPGTLYLAPFTWYGFTRYLLPGTLCMAPFTWGLLPGTLYLVPLTWSLLPCTLYSVSFTWYLLAGTLYLVPFTWYPLPGTLYLLPGTFCLVPFTWYLLPPFAQHLLPILIIPLAWYLLPGAMYLVPVAWAALTYEVSSCRAYSSGECPTKTEASHRALHPQHHAPHPTADGFPFEAYSHPRAIAGRENS